jgi:hypothetical protein
VNRRDEAPRRVRTAVANALLLRAGPPLAGDRFAGQVHQRAGGADLGRPWTHSAIRIPRDCTRARWQRAARAAREDDDLVSILKQRRGERSTEKARSAGDHDPHAFFNPGVTSKIPQDRRWIRRWNRRRRP